MLKHQFFMGRPKQLFPALLFTDDPFWKISKEESQQVPNYATVFRIHSNDALGSSSEHENGYVVTP
jgi:hypothetical protein